MGFWVGVLLRVPKGTKSISGLQQGKKGTKEYKKCFRIEGITARREVMSLAECPCCIKILGKTMLIHKGNKRV